MTDRHSLKGKEREIVVLLARGRTLAEIAEEFKVRGQLVQKTLYRYRVALGRRTIVALVLDYLDTATPEEKDAARVAIASVVTINPAKLSPAQRRTLDVLCSPEYRDASRYVQGFALGVSHITVSGHMTELYTMARFLHERDSREEAILAWYYLVVRKPTED